MSPLILRSPSVYVKHFLYKLFDLHLKHEKKKKKMEPVHLKKLAKCFFLYSRATVF